MSHTPIAVANSDLESALAAEGPLDILVVEDSKSQLMYLESNLQAKGHRVRCAENAAQAVALLQAALPDMLLLDVVLPDLSGIELLSSVHSIARQQWIPTLLMSAVDSSDEIVRGLEAGADDYIVKPINMRVLSAKIRSLQRLARTNAKLAESAQLLERYRETAETELQLARSLIQHMIKRDALKDPAIEWYILPSARFSGDIVASVRSEADELYVLFADASGHGLAAAISGLPVLQVFYSMAGRGMKVGEVAREMNLKLREYLPLGRYLATLLLRVNFTAREVEVWNGGMPSGIVIEADDALVVDALRSRQLPLGVAPRDVFDATTVTLPWSKPARLVFVSDGLLEAADPVGEAFGLARLNKAATRRAGSGVVAPIIHALRSHLKGLAAHDDVSILSVALP